MIGCGLGSRWLGDAVTNTLLSNMPQKKTIQCATGETRLVQQQWAGECEERGTEIVDSTWASKDGSSLHGQALAGTLASVLISPRGSSVLSNTVILANGETLVAWFKVEVGS